MKRMHIHISVDDLSKNINFYSTLFGVLPTIEHQDYAKWKLDDPAVNFAISTQGHASGLNHLGIQVDSEKELATITQRLEQAEMAAIKQEGVSCCYAHSNKHWVFDPQGIAWESFHSLGDAPIFSPESKEELKSNSADKSSCSIPLNPNPIKNENDACCIPNDASTCCS